MARKVTQVEYGGPAYRRALDLREEVLRKPLGLRWSEEERRAEPGDRHFALVEDQDILACLSCRTTSDGPKIRQMAVRTDRQGQGCGRELVEEVCARLRGERADRVFLHAREAVVGFYQALGFHPVGEGFTEVGLPHRRMEIALR